MYTIYRAVGPALGACICHIHHIQCSGASFGGLYMPYTPYTGQWDQLWGPVYAIYTIYRAVGPALGACICHIHHIQGSGTSFGGLYMPYTPYTGQWDQLWGPAYAIYTIYRAVGPALGACICHIHHIQGSGTSFGGLYMPYTPYTGQWDQLWGPVYAIYTIYRAVGPALGACIGHIHHIQGSGTSFGGLYRPYTPYTGQWDQLWGPVYAIYTIYRAVGPALGACICHIHHIQCSGASFGGLYMPYTPYTGQWDQLWGPVYAIYTIYRAVGPALGACICHIHHIQGSGTSFGGLYMPYTPYTGQWDQLWGPAYAIYTIYRAVGPALGACICHIHHIQGSGTSFGGLYMPYTPYTGQWDQLWGPVYAIYTIYRAVGPALGACIGHIHHIQGSGTSFGGLYRPYTPYTGQWDQLWGPVYAIYTIYRAVGPALGACICHIHHIQGSGASFGGLYMPYTPYTGQWDQLWGPVYAIYTIYRAVGPALGACICHIHHIQGSGASYMPYTGQYEKEIFSLSLGPAAA